MTLLLLKARRDLRALGMRAWGIAACVGLGAAVYVGGFAARDSLFHTRDSTFERLRLSDLQVILAPPADASELPDLSAIPGVGAASARFSRLGTLERPDGSPLSVVAVHLDPGPQPQVNRLELLEGRWLDPERTDEVLIEKTMRNVLGYRVGQSLTLDPYYSPWDVTIVGVVQSPEFLLPTANPDVMLPAKGSLGVIFASIRRISDTFGEAMFNDLSFAAALGTSQAELETAVTRTLSAFKVERFTPRAQQFGYRYLQEDLKAFDIFIPVTVSLFAFVTAVMVLLSVNRLVASQEREIGALLAQGFPARRLALGFLWMSSLVALAGLGVAAVLAPLVRDLFATQYAANVGLPEPELLMPVGLVARASAGVLILTLLFTCVPLIRIARLQPQRVLRGAIQESFRTPPRWVEALTRWLSGSSTARRHALRNLIRRPRLTTAVVLLIALSIGLSTAFVLSQSAWTRYAHEAFAHEHWDAIASFRVPLAPADLAPIAATAGVSNPRPLLYGSGTVIDGEARLDMRFVGIPIDVPTRNFSLVEGVLPTSTSAREVLLNRTFTGGHRFRAGSTVILETHRGERYDARVAGVFSDVTMGVAYLPVGFAREVLGQPEKTNGVFLDIAGDPFKAKKALFAHEMVQYVNLKAEMEALTWEYMKVMWALVTVALVLAVALGVLFVLTGLSLTLLEREGEYVTVRALGFADRPVAAIILWEVAMIGAAAAVASVPLSMAMGHYLEIEMARAWLHVPLVYDPWEMAAVALPVLIFVPVAALPGIRHVLRLNLVQVLRRRSFG